MTYVVGARYDGNTTIICDSRVQFDRGRTAENTWLKCGMLFPGCMFAYCGAVYPAHEFIVATKRQLTGTNDSVGFWSAFRSLAAAYPFSSHPDDQFELLLSSRTSGSPELIVFDSKNKDFRAAGDLVTLGSGKDLLDRFVAPTCAAKEKLLSPEVRSIHPAMWPANLCLQLMERAQGHEAVKLNDAGVGGYFHFGLQTPHGEFRQPPILHVLCDPLPEKQIIATWAFRIAFCEAALVIECPIRQQRSIILDPAAWPRCLELTPDELTDLKSHIDQLTEADPYYNICGFGTVNPRFRRHNPMVATSERRYLIDRSGTQMPEFGAMARGVFQNQVDLISTLSELQMRCSPPG